jgi:hypothetical protein
LIIISELVKQKGLVKIRTSLLPGVDWTVFTRCLFISPVFPESKVTVGEKGSEQETEAKWRQSLYPAFHSIWTFAGPSEESVLLAKAVSKYMLYCQ